MVFSQQVKHATDRLLKQMPVYLNCIVLCEVDQQNWRFHAVPSETYHLCSSLILLRRFIKINVGFLTELKRRKRGLSDPIVLFRL